MKNCSRCNKEIICNVDDIVNCECSEIILAKDTKEFLSNKTAYDCLCNDCLLHFDHLIERASNNNNLALEENIHYYLEGDKLVFSELYHAIRGYCCKSGCRHCVYGYKL